MSKQPDYVSFEPRGREELLSQIGSFSPVERALFQRLCDAWAPRIDVERILRSASSAREQELTALERLMAKLRTAQLGLITTSEGDEGRKPHQVMLTGKGSLEFWSAFLGEIVGRLLSTGHRILPSERRLREHKALPPDYHVTDISSTDLIAAYQGSIEVPPILRLRLLGDYRIVLTPETSRPLVQRALGILKRDLEERGIVEELARLKDTSMGDIKQRLESKAPDVWLELSRLVVKERSTIAFRKNFEESDEIFQLAYFVMAFVDAQIGAAREQKEHDAEVDSELEALAARVLEAPAGTVSQDEFATIVDEMQAKLGSAAAIFQKRLTDELLTPRPRRKLPRVLYIHGLYIHSARVATAFETARSEVSQRLRNEYTDIMEAFLRGRSPEVGETFGSRELLGEDIARRVERLHPLLGELIARPQVVAEAVILDAKLKREGASPEELRGVLARYFDVDSSALLPLPDLLALSLVAIFDDAFARVGVIRQLLHRLSGRYDSLRATYVKRFGPKPRPRTSLANDTGPPSAGGRERIEDAPDDAGRRTRGTGARSRPQTVTSSRRRAAPKPAKPKPKSSEEIDRIWKDFDKALHTKPSKQDST